MKTDKPLKRKTIKRVRVVRLEIYINNDEERYESKFTYRGDKNDALSLIHQFIDQHRKEKKSDA